MKKLIFALTLLVSFSSAHAKLSVCIIGSGWTFNRVNAVYIDSKGNGPIWVATDPLRSSDCIHVENGAKNVKLSVQMLGAWSNWMETSCTRVSLQEIPADYPHKYLVYRLQGDLVNYTCDLEGFEDL